MRSLSLSLSVFVAIAIGVLAPNLAQAAIGACGANDAPADFASASCQSVCTESGNQVTCELETLCPESAGLGATARAVRIKSSSHDVSMFGQCIGAANPAKFCCVFDEGATNVNVIELNGTPFADEILGLTFVDPITGDRSDLFQWDTDPLLGVIRGNKGDDFIEGSFENSSGYEDELFGQDNADIIHGNDGDDLLIGGDGADDVEGGNGNDTLWGGDGNDDLFGEAGTDVLCDASGYNYCAANHKNFMDGGSGNDKLWYDESENPNVPCPAIYLDTTSTAGSGTTDQCGDENDYTHAQLAGDCETYITTAPVQCEAAH